jgi:hypothetical protein
MPATWTFDAANRALRSPMLIEELALSPAGLPGEGGQGADPAAKVGESGHETDHHET